MKQLKKTILTLVALLAVTTGAWAESKPIGLNVEYEAGDEITSTTDVYVYYGEQSGTLKKMGVKITSTQPLTISMIFDDSFGFNGDDAVYYLPDGVATGGSAGAIPCVGESTGDATVVHVASGSGTLTDPYVFGSGPAAASATPVPLTWDAATPNTATLTNGMPAGNVTVSVEYFAQAEFAKSTDATLAPAAIADVPANTDAPIVTPGTVADIGTSEVKQGTLMYFVSQSTDNTVPDAPTYTTEGWSENVPTANGLKQGDVYVWYYIKGAEPANIADRTDANTRSDSDIMPLGSTGFVTIAAEPTKVTMAVNDKTMGTAEVCGQSKVEWTADTWKGWTQNTKEYTVDDITMTSSESAHIREYTSEDQYNNSLFFFVRKMVDDATVTFSTTGDPFSRIEFTMIGDYSERNPNIIPNDNWTFEGKSAVWEGEATKSLTLQSCSTNVSKITFFKGAIPDGVTINGDGTFTVAKTATVTLKATPAEGYKFLYWEDNQTNTNPVREVTIESGMADMTYKAVFAEILYNVTFAEGTNPDPENPEWTASPNTDVKKGQTVTVTYTGSKKVIGVKAEKKAAGKPVATLTAATAEDYGKVVCAAGHLHDAKTAVPDGCTAVGILGKVTETGHGLILAMQNATEQTWTTINGWTSASYAGTTLKLLPDDTARGSLTSYTTLGETAVSNWAVAQKGDYEAIFENLGSTTGNDKGKTYDDNVNAYITTGVGSTAIDGRYWSATEDGGNYAWYFRSDKWSSDNKGESHNVRPVLGF